MGFFDHQKSDQSYLLEIEKSENIIKIEKGEKIKIEKSDIIRERERESAIYFRPAISAPYLVSPH